MINSKKFLKTSLVVGTAFALSTNTDAKGLFSYSNLGSASAVRAVLSSSAVNLDLACGDKKAKDHKCGEGKCGDKKAKKDHKCGEGKCGDKKAKDHKCGEGKCGDKKAKGRKHAEVVKESVESVEKESVPQL